MARKTRIRGRVWVIANDEGILIDDIDTDQIYHNSHLAVTEMEKMGQYAFGNLEGWEDFPQRAKDGDIIIVGKNFGCGSSRQQAVDCFRSLGISAIVAISFGAIYKRNAINSGMAIQAIPSMNEKCPLENSDRVELNLESGELVNMTRDISLEGAPASKVQLDIYRAGGLFAYGRRQL
ncbi:MAG: 3-isopropylmalate dehydratase [bacterium]